MRRRALAALGLVAALAAVASAADGPTAVVQKMTQDAVDQLGRKDLSTEEKRHQVEQIAYANVDFDTMSRLVLARNWSQLSPAQQGEFVKLFKEHLALTYGRNIESYHNERVEVAGDRDEGRGDWTVKTKIVRGGGNADVLVDYRLRKEGDAWRVIDIVIERVSLVANFRSQFQEIMSHGGATELLDLLRQKNARGEPLKAPGAKP
jgi:phospholipid transport system substrate-binding protein